MALVRNLAVRCHSQSALSKFRGFPTLLRSSLSSIDVFPVERKEVVHGIRMKWPFCRDERLSDGVGIAISLAAWKALQPRRDFKRDLFLRGTSDHAALQYLGHEYQGVAVLSLNRVEARNAIGAEMLKQLHGILQGMRHATSARVLIVCSTVPGVFCAGADLKERRSMGFSETEKFVSSLRSTFSSLEELQIPTIAVIEGAAMGGGLELALACDLRVCGEEAVFGLPETSLAVIPGAGGTQRLPRVIGRSKAKELIFTADRIDAKRADALGSIPGMFHFL